MLGLCAALHQRKSPLIFAHVWKQPGLIFWHYSVRWTVWIYCPPRFRKGLSDSSLSWMPIMRKLSGRWISRLQAWICMRCSATPLLLWNNCPRLAHDFAAIFPREPIPP